MLWHCYLDRTPSGTFHRPSRADAVHGIPPLGTVALPRAPDCDHLVAFWDSILQAGPPIQLANMLP